jgi:hypothetical protein
MNVEQSVEWKLAGETDAIPTDLSRLTITTTTVVLLVLPFIIIIIINLMRSVVSVIQLKISPRSTSILALKSSFYDVLMKFVNALLLSLG